MKILSMAYMLLLTVDLLHFLLIHPLGIIWLTQVFGYVLFGGR
jgi:hypothetical protein